MKKPLGRIVPSILAVHALVLACSALGAPPQPYTLGPGSTHVQEHCLSPCLCPPYTLVGHVEGGFLLTFVNTDPQGFDHYAVTGIDGVFISNVGVAHFTGSGTYRIGGPVGLTHQLKATIAVGQDEARGYDSGLVPVDPQHPFPEIAILIDHESVCRHFTFTLFGAPDGCYADCDQTGALTVADFVCFQTRFVNADPYADCTADQQFTVADFVCFQGAFVAGCP